MGPQVSGRVPTPDVSKEAEERARQGPGDPVMFSRPWVGKPRFKRTATP